MGHLASLEQPLFPKVTPTRPDRTTRIVLPQEVDQASGAAFSSTLTNALSRSDRIELVGQNVRFIDSGGLRFLMEARRRGSTNGVHVVLVQPSEVLTSLIAATRLVDYFEVDDGPDRHSSVLSWLTEGHDAHWFPVAQAPAPT